MQNSEITKISRRFYIDHAGDDRAVVRAVPVTIGRDAQPAIHQVTPPEAGQPSAEVRPPARRFSRLVHSAVRHTHRNRD